MRTLTRTHTRTYNATRWADPYKKCLACNGWVDGALDAPGPLLLTPCEHRSSYRDVCSSWGPVDGCRCAEAGIEHEVRVPERGDTRRY
jgi:hypothetical protein